MESHDRADDEIWRPDGELRQKCQLQAFAEYIATRGAPLFYDYDDLHTWSCRHPKIFWPLLISFLGILKDGDVSPIYHDAATQDLTIHVPLARRWFPEITLSFAENILRNDSDEDAIIAWSENRARRVLSRRELRRQVACIQEKLNSLGVAPGDKVFGYLPNIPEAVAAMLGATSLGATWSSCGTDYQVDGLLSRLKRVEPKILFATARYLWRGKEINTLPILEQVLTSVPSIQHVIIVDYLSSDSSPASSSPASLNIGSHRCSAFSDILSQKNHTPHVHRFSFSHPHYIMFSSGTTGTPKGIIHSAGGTLLEQMKEMVLHSDIRPGERVMYQTSTSWMMWNWLVTGLACGASILLYDGDPMLEEGHIIWRMVDEEKVTHYGTSASFLNAVEKKGVSPNQSYSFNSLRALLSTGSTLFPSQFDYIFSHIKKVWIQSISGGTDILGCFALGCPWKPVVRGAIQSKSLGYDVRVFNEEGKAVVEEEGELVCVAPAPSMPVGFLHDPDGSQYREAYFSQYPGVWRHGDIVEDSEFGLYFRGRSDATLKPGGVRIATADVYSALGGLPYIEHSLAVGYTPIKQNTERIILFLVLPEGDSLDESRVQEVKDRLRRSNLFYVPALIIQAPQVPRTTNGKLSELSVKRILAGKDSGNSAALSNPECLDWYKGEGKRRVEEFFLS